MVGNEEKLQVLFPYSDGCYPKFYWGFSWINGVQKPGSLHHPCSSLRKPLASSWDCFIPYRRSAFCPFRTFSVTWVCEYHECQEYWFQENHKQVSLVSLDKRIDTGKLAITHALASRTILPKSFTLVEKSHHFRSAHFVLTFHSESQDPSTYTGWLYFLL